MLSEFKMLEELGTLNTNIAAATESSNKNSKAINSLTVALVSLTLAQVLIAILNYQTDKSIIEAKQNCYKNVLQTSDIDLNYKNCLRSKGLSD